MADGRIMVTLDVPDEDAEPLLQLMETCGLTTPEELMRDAQEFMVMCADEVQEGRAIASIDERAGKYRTVTMEWMRNVQLAEEYRREFGPDQPRKM